MSDKDKKDNPPQTMPNMQNTAYFDLNRNFSIKSDDTSMWEYPLNNGMKLPAGTTVEVINTHLNYPGIVGSAIEINDDIEEEICYGFYNTHGTFNTLTSRKTANIQAGEVPAKENTNGIVQYDCMAHRNTENTTAPLLQGFGAIGGDPSNEITSIEAVLATYTFLNQVPNPTPGVVPYKASNLPLYNHFYTNFDIVNQGEGYTVLSIGVRDRIVGVSIDTPGSGYSPGDYVNFTGGTTSPRTAFAYVYEVTDTGGLKTIYLEQTGENYTSTPTATVVSPGGGTGGAVTAINGRLCDVTTSGSGRGMIIGLAGTFVVPVVVGIIHPGAGYRPGDTITIMDGEISSGVDFFPENLPLTHYAVDEAMQITPRFCNSLDIPSPGILSMNATPNPNAETIYYASCNSASDTIVGELPILRFTMNENPQLLNDNYIDTGKMYAQTPADPMLQALNVTYEIELKEYKYPPETGDPTTPGSNYMSIPQIRYKASQYEERFLNTNTKNPMFLAVMTAAHTVDRVVYIGNCQDDLSCQNTDIDFNIRTKITEGFAGCPPGNIDITGGGTPTPAFARFKISDQGGAGPPVTQPIYSKPQPLKRYFKNTSGVKLGLNVAVVTRGTNGAPGTYNLEPIPGNNLSGTGTGCQVDVTLGYNTTVAPAFCINVTASGSGYRKGERYRIQGQFGDLELIILELAPNPDVISPAGGDFFFLPNSITGGIMDSFSNSLVKPTLLKGVSKDLVGDLRGTTFQPVLNSQRPRFDYLYKNLTNFDSIQGCGGSNDPIGLCEIDENGFLKPVVIKTAIKINKGVYGVNQLASLISDQLTVPTEATGFLNESAVSKFVTVSNYEMSKFTGIENNNANRQVFVAMSVYNTLMGLYRDGETIPDTYKWDNFCFTHYYAFPKNLFPSGKRLRQQGASMRITNRGGTGSLITQDNTILIADNTVIYDQTRDGILAGSTDFQLVYDSTKSIFSLKFLHSAIRSPNYDLFGNAFPQSGQIGAYIKKLPESVNVRGITKEFLEYPGGEYETDEALIKRFENPVTRDTGVMIYNFAFDTATSKQQKTISNTLFARYEDFFTEGATARSVWTETIWARLGFKYEQLNTDLNKEDCQYLFTDSSRAVKMFGITTDQTLDSSITTTVSTRTNVLLSGPKQTNQILFNMTAPNTPAVPCFSEGNYIKPDASTTAPAPVATPLKLTVTDTYAGGLYNSAITNFIITDADNLDAENLPLLIQEGYFLITSDIIDSYKDSVKKNENIPVLAIVPKSNLASQDFVTTAFTNITHTISQEKVLNKIMVKVLNPDLTAPILREDSSVMIKITIPQMENVGI
jgi:hypothetical protein